MAEGEVRRVMNKYVRRAVADADDALGAILEKYHRANGEYTAQEVNAIASAFYDWLCDHPDIEDAIGIEEPTSVEEYIERHSDYWTIVYRDLDPDQGTYNSRITIKLKVVY